MAVAQYHGPIRVFPSRAMKWTAHSLPATLTRTRCVAASLKPYPHLLPFFPISQQFYPMNSHVDVCLDPPLFPGRCAILIEGNAVHTGIPSSVE